MRYKVGTHYDVLHWLDVEAQSSEEAIQTAIDSIKAALGPAARTTVKIDFCLEQDDEAEGDDEPGTT